MRIDMWSKAEQLADILKGYDHFYYEDVVKNAAGEQMYKIFGSYDSCECTAKNGLRFFSSFSESNTLHIEGEISGFSIEEVDSFADKLTVSGITISCRKGLALNQILK